MRITRQPKIIIYVTLKYPIWIQKVNGTVIMVWVFAGTPRKNIKTFQKNSTGIYMNDNTLSMKNPR